MPRAPPQSILLDSCRARFQTASGMNRACCTVRRSWRKPCLCRPSVHLSILHLPCVAFRSPEFMKLYALPLEMESWLDVSRYGSGLNRSRDGTLIKIGTAQIKPQRGQLSWQWFTLSSAEQLGQKREG